MALTMQCPRCGENNPEQALSCWACFLPFDVRADEFMSEAAPQRMLMPLPGDFIAGRRGDEVIDLDEISDQPPPVYVANWILRRALSEAVEQVDVAPSQKGADIIFWKGQQFTRELLLPRYVYVPLVQRFKILADLDIIRKNQIQRGTLTARLDEQNYTVDIAIVPKNDGENVVIVPRLNNNP